MHPLDVVEQVIHITKADGYPHSKRTLGEHIRNCAKTAVILGLSDDLVIACGSSSVLDAAHYQITNADLQGIQALMGKTAFDLIVQFSNHKRKSRWWLKPGAKRAVNFEKLVTMELINLAEQA